MERIKINMLDFERLMYSSDNILDIEDFVELTFEPYLKSSLTELEELKKVLYNLWRDWRDCSSCY